MDKSSVQDIVESNIERLQQLFGLESWKIIFEYDSFADGIIKGSCDSLVGQRKALIILDPKAIQDETEAIEVLTHELLHLITSTFHTYKAAVSCLVDSENTLDAIGIIFTRAEEEAVSNFCHILERIKSKPPQVR